MVDDGVPCQACGGIEYTFTFIQFPMTWTAQCTRCQAVQRVDLQIASPKPKPKPTQPPYSDPFGFYGF